MKSNIIVYSGGLDSSVLLQIRDDIGLAINFNYGSKHNKREREYARLNCKEAGIELREINLNFLEYGIKSDLLINGGDIPEGHYESPKMKKTVVPFRNGIMLSIATAIAESEGYNGILIANHSGDHEIYPDCRRGFIGAMGEAIAEGTYGKIKILSPFVDMNKRQIALIGKEHEIDFNKTYSCYKGGKKHCGVCGTCIERKEALFGFDTTEYER